MSIVDPLSCGLVKCVKQVESWYGWRGKAQWIQARLLKTKCNEYTTYFRNITSFNVEQGKPLASSLCD